MGMTGEIIAQKYDLGREEIDQFAFRSHQLAAKAHEDGKFKDEILPVKILQRRGDPITFDRDEGVRKDTSVEKLGNLRPVFKKDGLVTAGNASQISDGAAVAVITTEEKADKLGIKPLARIHSYHTAGVEPELVMYAPVPAIYQLLEKTGFAKEDIDLWEHNEAFASASLAIQTEFEIPEDKFNVHGGAVAIGHPIGASGARVMATMLYAMKEKGAKRGLEAVCLGGGHAVTMIVERD
jgi:acetyl-CoA C-acetyltransferase